MRSVEVNAILAIKILNINGKVNYIALRVEKK